MYFHQKWFGVPGKRGSMRDLVGRFRLGEMRLMKRGFFLSPKKIDNVLNEQ
jgi:hypothetical protein